MVTYCHDPLSEPTSLRLMEVRAMPGEVHLVRLPGSPIISLTRSEAQKLEMELCAALKMPEPWIPRVSIWRRMRDGLRRLFNAETRRQEALLRKRAQALLDAGSVRRV